MNVALHIARRYVFARKSHRAIGIISAVSATGIALGTAALVVILSVFNGFGDLIQGSLNTLDPDLKVSPATGKVMRPDEPAFRAAIDWAYEEDAVETLSGIVEEQVFLYTEGRQTLVLARGVDEAYLADTPLKERLTAGTLSLDRGGNCRIAVGAQIAEELDIRPQFPRTVSLYFPSRTLPVSLQNPAASLRKQDYLPGGVFSTGSEYDARLVLVPLRTLRALLEYEDELSAVEIRFAAGTSDAERKRIETGLRERLGNGYSVRDRVEQNQALFKMLNYEKGAIYLILLFIVLVVAFNIFGSLSMLILEKKGDIRTLESLGADRSLVRRIFFTEGILVSLGGLAAGLLIGIAVTLLQQHVGLVTMPGAFALRYYPVVLRASDLLATAGGVAAVGLVIAFLSSRNIHPRTI